MSTRTRPRTSSKGSHRGLARRPGGSLRCVGTSPHGPFDSRPGAESRTLGTCPPGRPIRTSSDRWWRRRDRDPGADSAVGLPAGLVSGRNPALPGTESDYGMLVVVSRPLSTIEGEVQRRTLARPECGRRWCRPSMASGDGVAEDAARARTLIRADQPRLDQAFEALGQHVHDCRRDHVLAVPAQLRPDVFRVVGVRDDVRDPPPAPTLRANSWALARYQVLSGTTSSQLLGLVGVIARSIGLASGQVARSGNPL